MNNNQNISSNIIILSDDDMIHAYANMYIAFVTPVMDDIRSTTTSLFLTLNIQISHHLQIARLIEAGGV